MTLGFAAAGKLGKASLDGAACLGVDVPLAGLDATGVALLLVGALAHGTADAAAGLGPTGRGPETPALELELAFATAPQPREGPAALAANAR